MSIIVCPLSLVESVVAARRPSHLVSLLDPDHIVRTPEAIAGDRHLRIGVHDICDVTEGLLRPEAEHVAQVVEFGRTWAGEAPILIHCWAGISRSTAVAFTLACERNPSIDEAVIARKLRDASETATPNRRIVALADNMLGRGGRMLAAIDAIGLGPTALEGKPFELPANSEQHESISPQVSATFVALHRLRTHRATEGAPGAVNR